MKKSIYTFVTVITFITGAMLLTSCGSGTTENSESAEQHDMDGHDHDEMALVEYSCPMHSDVTGKEGDKCSKCGMALTKSKDADQDSENMDMSAMAKCPMHPEETGKAGDKCSKCGMALVLNESTENENGEHSHEN